MNAIVVDVLGRKKECQYAKAYISDPNGPGIIVYDYFKNSSWRVEHPTFNYTPGNETITVDGHSFNYTGGVFGLAFKKVKNNDNLPYKDVHIDELEHRALYYHSLNSVYENRVSLSTLADEEGYQKNVNSHSGAFERIGDR